MHYKQRRHQDVEMRPSQQHKSVDRSFVEKTKNFFRREKTFDEQLLCKRTSATKNRRRHKSHDANKVKRNHSKHGGRKSSKEQKVKESKDRQFYGHVQEVIYCEVKPSMPFRMCNDKSATKVRDIFKMQKGHELREPNEFAGQSLSRKSRGKSKCCGKSRDNSRHKGARTNSTKNEDSGSEQKLSGKHVSPAAQRLSKTNPENEEKRRKRHKRERKHSSKENEIENRQHPDRQKTREEKHRKKQNMLEQTYVSLSEKIEEDMKNYFAQIQVTIDKKLELILKSQKGKQSAFPFEEDKQERKISKKVDNVEDVTRHGDFTKLQKCRNADDKERGICCHFDCADVKISGEIRKHFERYGNSEIAPELRNRKLKEVLLSESTMEEYLKKKHSSGCSYSVKNGEDTVVKCASANIQTVLDQRSSKQEFVVQGIEPPSLEHNIKKSKGRVKPRQFECKTVSVIAITPNNHHKKANSKERETQTEKRKSSKMYREYSSLESRSGKDIIHEKVLDKTVADVSQSAQAESSDVLKGYFKKFESIQDLKRSYFKALSSSNSVTCLQTPKKSGRTRQCSSTNYTNTSKLKLEADISIKDSSRITRSKSGVINKPNSANDSIGKESRSGKPRGQHTLNEDKGFQTSKIKVEVRSTAAGGDKKHHRNAHTSNNNVGVQISRGTSARKMEVTGSPPKSPKRLVKESAVAVSCADMISAPAKLTTSRGVSPINFRSVHVTRPPVAPTPKPRSCRQSARIRVDSKPCQNQKQLYAMPREKSPIANDQRPLSEKGKIVAVQNPIAKPASVEDSPKKFEKANVQCTVIRPQSRKDSTKKEHITEANVPVVKADHATAISQSQSEQNTVDVCFHLPYSGNEKFSRKRECCTTLRSITANAMLENTNSMVKKVSSTTSSSTRIGFLRKSKSLVEIRPRKRNITFNDSKSEVGSITRSALEKFANQPKQRLQSSRSKAQSLDQYLGKFTSRLFLTKDYKGSEVSSYQKRKLYDDSIRKKMKKKIKLSKNSIGPQIFEVRFLSMLENKHLIKSSAVHSIEGKVNTSKPATCTDLPHSLIAPRNEKSNVGKVREIYVNKKEPLMAKFWRKLLTINSTIAIPEGFEENQCSCTKFSKNCTACKNFVTLLDMFSSSMSAYCDGSNSHLGINTESTSEESERIRLGFEEIDCENSGDISYKSKMNYVNNSATDIRRMHISTCKEEKYVTHPTSCPVLTSRVSSFEYLYERDSNDASREIVFANLTRPFNQTFRFNPSQYNVETHFSTRNVRSSPCSSEESGYGSVKSKQNSSLDNFFKKPNIAALFSSCNLGRSEFCTISDAAGAEWQNVVIYETMEGNCQLNGKQVQEAIESVEIKEVPTYVELPLSVERDYLNSLESKSTDHNVGEQQPVEKGAEGKLESDVNEIESCTTIQVTDSNVGIALSSETMVDNAIRANGNICDIAEEIKSRRFFSILLKIYEKEVRIRKQLFEDLTFHKHLLSAVANKRNQEKRWKLKLRNILKKKEEREKADFEIQEGTDEDLISELREQLPGAKRCLDAIAQVAQISRSLEEELKINSLMKLLKRIEMREQKVARIFQNLDNGNLEQDVKGQVIQLFIDTCHWFETGNKLHRQKLGTEQLNLIKIFACKYGLTVDENLSIFVANYIARKVINSECRLRAAIAYLMRPKSEKIDALSLETFLYNE